MNIKSQETFKTIFDPLSEEWSETDYDEKKRLILQIFLDSEFSLHSRNTAFELYYAKLSIDEASLEEAMAGKPGKIKRNFMIPIINRVISVGLYLNRTFISDSEFPILQKDVKSLISSLKSLNDRRKKRSKELGNLTMQLYRGNTREFFDFDGSEGKSSGIPEKRSKLQKIIEKGFTPLDLLYMHTIDYDSMSNYRHVVNEAPCSAFALCWNGMEFY